MEPLKSFAFRRTSFVHVLHRTSSSLFALPVPPLITEILQSADIPVPSVPYEFQYLPYVRRQYNDLVCTKDSTDPVGNDYGSCVLGVLLQCLS